MSLEEHGDNVCVVRGKRGRKTEGGCEWVEVEAPGVSMVYDGQEPQ